MLRRACTLASVALASATFAATDAGASTQRTFVASYGSPTNTSFNCSIAKPCRAFSEAISVTGPKGEVVVLDSAGYGPVTITQPVSIIAPGGIYAGVTVSSGDGITVNVGASDTVVLRGLSINGQGGSRGIVFQVGQRLRIENCVVSGMSSDGIVHNATNGEMILLETIVRDNGGAGISASGDIVQVVLDHVRSEHNGGDGFYLSPASGSTGALATVIDSVFTHNLGAGIRAESVLLSTTSIVVERSALSNNSKDGFDFIAPGAGSGRATLIRNLINDNGGDGVLLQSAGNQMRARIADNAFHRNSGFGMRTSGPTFIQFNANTFHNYDSGDVHCDTTNTMRSAGNNSWYAEVSTVGCITNEGTL
jgi:hypothetical protein